MLVSQSIRTLHPAPSEQAVPPLSARTLAPPSPRMLPKALSP